MMPIRSVSKNMGEVLKIAESMVVNVQWFSGWLTKNFMGKLPHASQGLS